MTERSKEEMPEVYPTVCVNPDDLYAILLRVPTQLRDDAYWRVADSLPREPDMYCVKEACV